MQKKDKSTQRLTPKQEKFCQEYIITGNKSEAYRNSYSAGNMKSETINNKAYQLMLREDIRARVEQLQNELKKRNEITLDKVIKGIADIATFDIAELYDENGVFKNIHDIPKNVRTAISGIKTLEEFDGYGKDKESIGFTKDVKIINKLDAYRELMKYFGGYELHNKQKTDSVVTIFELPNDGRN